VALELRPIADPHHRTARPTRAPHLLVRVQLDAVRVVCRVP
jgi:hypothetical protein